MNNSLTHIRNALNKFKKSYLKKLLIKKASEINMLCLRCDVRVCFLDWVPGHWQFSASLIQELAKSHPVVLLVFDKSHPAYDRKFRHKNIFVFHLERKWAPFFLKLLRIPYLVTPTSHLHPSAIRSDMNIVHSYHSLVSMHVVYGDDAFDSYTHFLACGPHHVNEIIEIKKRRGLPRAKIYEVGYPKIDNINLSYLAKKNIDTTIKTIVLAPSWHLDNILKLYGDVICQSILDLGHNLIVRPHPQLYEGDLSTMSILRQVALRSNGRITIENPNENWDSYLKADLMVSDWSGVALEYSFATERPVVFIDAPRKVNSIDLLNIGLPTIEDALRDQIGIIVESSDKVGEGINKAFSKSAAIWAKQISDVRDRYIYNFRTSAISGAAVLKSITVDSAMLPEADLTPYSLDDLISYYF